MSQTMSGTVHLTLATNSERRAPAGRGDRARRLLDAITRLQAASGLQAIAGACVEAVERTLHGSAAGVFGMEQGAAVVSLRAAGHRWRTAERDSPAWLAGLGGPISNLVRSHARLRGGFATSDGTVGELHESWVEIVQAPVSVDARPWGSLVVVWPAQGCVGDDDVWFVEQLVAQVGLALGHAATATALQRSLGSLRVAQRGPVRNERLRVVGELASAPAHDVSRPPPGVVS